jgi:ribosomal protein S18 acetylase RimI-like enzyme
MAIQIREANDDEHDAAGRVTADAYREFFADGSPDRDHAYLMHIGNVAGRADRTTILVAVEDDAIVGTLTLELEGRIGDIEGDPALAPGEAHVRMLGIQPAARGRGIGKALMLEAERRAREVGKTYVTLHTTKLMTVAQRMYEDLGYRRVEDRVLTDGFVLLGYRKEL